MAKKPLDEAEKKTLIDLWKVIYFQGESIDEQSSKGGADWESLCVGFCLAHGLAINEAYAFYQQMISLQLF